MTTQRDNNGRTDMKTTLTAAMLSILCAAGTAYAQCSEQCASIHSPEVIEVNPASFPTTHTRGVQVRYNNERGVVAATQDAQGQVSWSGSQREAMGGEDAPARILVRAFDAVFSIDPFVPISSGNEDVANMLFNGATLETNRALFNRQRIERVEQLMEVLEAARHDWLRNNGYYGVRSFTSSTSTGEDAHAEASLPEPSASFRIPADVPRGKSREQVNAGDSNTRSIAANLLSGDEPVRISLPFGTASDVVARVEARNAEAANENAQELASND